MVDVGIIVALRLPPAGSLGRAIDDSYARAAQDRGLGINGEAEIVHM
jgi:hypothetical protein